MTKPALMVLRGITKSFKNGQESLQVLKGIDLSVEEGDFVAIMGPSGSGKSTLMNIIGLLDQPTTGSYQLEGEDVADLSENRLAKVRNDQIGFIFQQFFLLPKLSAQKNVELPLIYAGKSPRERKGTTILGKSRLVRPQTSFAVRAVWWTEAKGGYCACTV